MFEAQKPSLTPARWRSCGTFFDNTFDTDGRGMDPFRVVDHTQVFVYPSDMVMPPHLLASGDHEDVEKTNYGNLKRTSKTIELFGKSYTISWGYHDLYIVENKKLHNAGRLRDPVESWRLDSENYPVESEKTYADMQPGDVVFISVNRYHTTVPGRILLNPEGPWHCLFGAHAHNGAHYERKDQLGLFILEKK